MHDDSIVHCGVVEIIARHKGMIMQQKHPERTELRERMSDVPIVSSYEPPRLCATGRPVEREKGTRAPWLEIQALAI